VVHRSLLAAPRQLAACHCWNLEAPPEAGTLQLGEFWRGRPRWPSVSLPGPGNRHPAGHPPGALVVAPFPCRDRQANGGQPGETMGMASRGMVALAFLLVLVAPSIAQDRQGISVTFYRAQGAAQRSNPAAVMPGSMIGAFKVDPEAPIHIEADGIVRILDGQSEFSGEVKLHLGDFLLRTRTLTAFHLGQSGPHKR
jgi:hypothetical protein